jgi:hypothetical protein
MLPKRGFFTRRRNSTSELFHQRSKIKDQRWDHKIHQTVTHKEELSLSCLVLPCLGLLFSCLVLVLSCLPFVYLVLPCHVLPCLVSSSLVLSLSCPVNVLFYFYVFVLFVLFLFVLSCLACLV